MGADIWSDAKAISVCGDGVGRRAGNRDGNARAGIVERDGTSELRDIQRIGNIVHLNLRIRETGDFHVRARGSSGAEPIGIRGVGVRERKYDGLDQARIGVTIERGERDGVGAFVENALLHRESAGEIILAVKFQNSDGRTVHSGADAVRLSRCDTLQSYGDLRRNAGSWIVMRDHEVLINRFRIDECTEEVIGIGAVQQCREVGGALLQGDGGSETLHAGRAGTGRSGDGNALALLRAAHEPVDAGARERRVNSRAVKSDGAIVREVSALLAEDRHGLFDAFGVKLERARVRAGIKTRGEKLSAGDHVPAFRADGNLRCRERIEISAGDFSTARGSRGRHRRAWMPSHRSRKGQGFRQLIQQRGRRCGTRVENRRIGAYRPMRITNTVEINVFQNIGRARAALRIDPLICSRRVLGLPTAQQQRSAGDERRIELVAALRVLAINMEAEIANFLTRAPLQHDSTARARLRMERRQLHCRRRLDG